MKCEGYGRDILRIFIDTQEQVAVHMYGFDEIRRGNYFGGDPIRKTEIEVRVGSLRMESVLGRIRFRER